mgnify:FL=1
MADKTKRQSKKLDRIERRLDKGMKSERQAERNMKRADKIVQSNDRLSSRAAGVADAAHDQRVNLYEGADAFNNPIKKTSPFYKTGQAKSPLFKHVPGHVSKRAAPMEPGSDESFLGEGKGGYLQDRPMTNPTGAPEGSDSYYTGGEGGYLQGKPMNTSIIKGVPNASSELLKLKAKKINLRNQKKN